MATLVVSRGVGFVGYPVDALGCGVARCERLVQNVVGTNSGPVGRRWSVPYLVYHPCLFCLDSNTNIYIHKYIYTSIYAIVAPCSISRESRPFGQEQDATEPAPKRQRTFASSFGELRELHKMKDDGVIDGQEFERLKGLLMSELE